MSHRNSNPRRDVRGGILGVMLLLLGVVLALSLALFEGVRGRTQIAYLDVCGAKVEQMSQEVVTCLLEQFAEWNTRCVVSAYKPMWPDGPPALWWGERDEKALSIKDWRPLFSQADPEVDLGDYDINAEDHRFPYGWIGLQNHKGERRAMPVAWNLIRNQQGEIAGRFAYWMDDESSKIDLRYAGREGQNHKHLAGEIADISLHDLFENEVENFFHLRCDLGSHFTNPAMAKFMGPKGKVIRWNEWRANCTVNSEADARGIYGYRKQNVNRWVNQAVDYKTESGRAAIVSQVKAMAHWIQETLPEFGLRTCHSPIPEGDDARYLLKIAANLHDYIDEDHQPTVISHNGEQWEQSPDPFALQIGDGAPMLPPSAFGKENVPHITESLDVYKIREGRLICDHVIEVINPYSTSLNWGELDDPAVLIAERPAVQPRNAGDPDPDLAGETGLEPLMLPLPCVGELPGNTYQVLGSLSESDVIKKGYMLPGARWLQIPTWREQANAGACELIGDRTAIAADTVMEVVVVNRYGYLDIQPRVARQGGGSSTGVIHVRPNADEIWWGSQPFGNVPPASGANVARGYPLDSGDPRAATEIWPNYQESAGNISRIAWRRQSANIKGSGCYLRLGDDAISQERRSGWIRGSSKEFSAWSVPEAIRSNSNGLPQEAAAVIRDGAMVSIGEMGLIYDPAIEAPGRIQGTRPRGGFRTIEMVRDSNREKQSGSNLFEIFDVADNPKGRILLNSLERDPEQRVWRAALQEINYNEECVRWVNKMAPGDPATKKNKVNVDAFLKRLSERQHKEGPFEGLGKLAEICDEMTLEKNELLDRSQEELFRRLASMVCLKGDVYTLYVAVQTGNMNQGEFKVDATRRVRLLVRMKSVYAVEDSLGDPKRPPDIKNNKVQFTQPEIVEFAYE